MKYCLSALSEIDRALDTAKRILVATDFDGTLCPIASSPSEVHLAPAMLDVMRYVASIPRLELAVISGRALTDVQEHVPLDLIFAGNHGLEIGGRGLRFEHEEARLLRPALVSGCEALLASMQEWPAAWIEDKELSATLHYRAVEERQQYALISAARRCLAGFGPQLAFRVGKRALEVRPRVAWDKGSALGYIRERMGPFDACVCLGDDRTDETMFRANEGGLNIRIGCARPTAASYCLSDPAEVALFFSHLIDLCGSEVPEEAVHYATM